VQIWSANDVRGGYARAGDPATTRTISIARFPAMDGPEVVREGLKVLARRCPRPRSPPTTSARRGGARRVRRCRIRSLRAAETRCDPARRDR